MSVVAVSYQFKEVNEEDYLNHLQGAMALLGDKLERQSKYSSEVASICHFYANQVIAQLAVARDGKAHWYISEFFEFVG